jgi:hypothetical protein
MHAPDEEWNRRLRVVSSRDHPRLLPWLRHVVRPPRALKGPPVLLFRAVVRTIDSRRTWWCVLSIYELITFPRTWGVFADRVVHTLFAHTLCGSQLKRLEARIVDERVVFSGDDSLRDYPLLIETSGDAPAWALPLPLQTGLRVPRPRTDLSAFQGGVR